MDCKTCSDAIKRIAGWVFADMLHFYFGDTALVFLKEGPGGTDIKFAATKRFVVANSVLNFGMTQDEADEFLAHVESCSSPECVEAAKRIKTIDSFFEEGKIPGGAPLALISVFQSRMERDVCGISRDNGFGEAIDQILPFIMWFIEDRDFWKWPE